MAWHSGLPIAKAMVVLDMREPVVMFHLSLALLDSECHCIAAQ
jgi:hypothetical protein